MEQVLSLHSTCEYSSREAQAVSWQPTLPHRLVSAVIDSSILFFLQFILLGPLVYLYYVSNEELFLQNEEILVIPYQYEILFCVAYYAIAFFYYLVQETLTDTTYGKRVVGLHVVNNIGQQPTPIQTFIRCIFAPLEMIFPFLSVLPLLITKGQQRLADFIAGTRVVFFRETTDNFLYLSKSSFRKLMTQYTPQEIPSVDRRKILTLAYSRYFMSAKRGRELEIPEIRSIAALFLRGHDFENVDGKVLSCFMAEVCRQQERGVFTLEQIQ